MDELCSTCLSKHRKLVPLSTIEVISSHLETIPFPHSPVLVCWECNSRLQKMRAFTSQATKAQELLKLYLENKKPMKALRSLSKLSISSTKTEYDENIVYCMKQETVECEEDLIDDFQSDIKYDTEVIEHIPKAEKIDIDIQESNQSEPPGIDNYIQELPSKYLYVTVEPLTESRVGDGDDSDEWPLSKVTKEKVCKNECDIKTELKNDEIEQYDGKLSKNEDNFDIKMMSFEEMYKLRDEDRKSARYMSCPFKCATCITGYFVEKKYNAHLLMKHSEDIGPHTCDICLTRHKSADLLARHREIHLHSYHCRECPFTSRKLHLMHLHQSEHGTETFSCEICGLSTLTKGKLRYHMKKMHKTQPVCKTCGKEFASAENLRRHVIVKHDNGNSKFEKCAVCCGMYRDLAAHARKHAPAPAPEPKAFCVECGISYKNKHNLRKHLIVHSKHKQQTKIEWYVCDECGRRFTNKTSLERHTASRHMKQFPFNCDICHKGYAWRVSLKNHVLERHEGVERPRKNVCSYCGKAFKDKQVLTNHIRTHTGERPFQCALCPRSFAQRVALRTHERALHPSADTGNTANTGGAGGSGDTDDGRKAEKSGKEGRQERAVITEK